MLCKGTKGSKWSLDRRIPISLLIVATIQLLAFARLAYRPVAHQNNPDGRVVLLEAETDRARTAASEETFSRIEDNLENMLAALIRSERKLEPRPENRR